MDSGPLLALAADSSGSSLYTGGLDGSVKKFDIESSTVTTLGFHSPHLNNLVSNENDDDDVNVSSSEEVACSCLSVLQPSRDGSSTSILASAGWDSNFYLWDVRTSSKTGAVANIKLPDKAFSMDVDPSTGNRIAIATSGLKLVIIDVRMMNNASIENTTAEIVLNRDSSLKYQSRVCKFFPDGIGVAIGSIEGRVALEFLNELGVSSGGMTKYAFKCHRQEDIVYPVNAIAFHPSYGTFATGGCDGTVVTWDGLHKKKLAVLPQFPAAIAAMAFNHDGSELAIASSYTFEEGENGGSGVSGSRNAKDEIYIRSMIDSEVRPKGK